MRTSSRSGERGVELLRRNAWWLYLSGAAVLTLLFVAIPPLKASAPLMNLLGLSGVLAVAAGIKLHRPHAGGAWWLFVLGLLFYWLGDVYVFSYAELVGRNVTAPSPGDALHVALFPTLLAGLIVLVRRRNRVADGPGLIDALIMTVGLGLVSVTFLIDPYLHDHALTLLPKLVSIAYPSGGILLLAVGIRLAVDAGTRRPAFFLLIASIVTLLVTDFVYGLLTLHGGLHHQLSLDVGWIFFDVFWGAAALHPSMRGLSDAGRPRSPRLTPLRLSLLAGSTLIAPVIELAKASGHHDGDAVFTISASIVLFALVVGRMADLVHQRENAAGRERALTDAGRELVAASSPRDIVAAALEGAGALTRGVGDPRLCEPDGDDLVISALRDGRVSRWTAGHRVPAFLTAAGDDAAHALPGSVRAALQLPEDTVEAVVVKIGEDGANQSWLVVTGAGAANGETRYALRSLASQVALARERSQLGETIHRQQSEARISTLVQNSSDLITVLDANLTIDYQSPSIEAILGYAASDVVGRPFEQLLHATENNRLLMRLSDIAALATSRPDPIECVLAHHDGEPRHFEITHSALIDDGGVQGIILNGRDVSERKAFEEQLAHQAFHDPVTLLANRALFNERVRHAVARAMREQIGLAAIFVDLDDFKTVNDSLGHAAGDLVLIEAAQRISASVRAADTAARFGGDEFAILLEDVDDVQTAAETAERVLEALGLPVELEHKSHSIRASLGISFAPPGTATNADELIRNADAAMYIAKSDGKGGYRVFEPRMHERVLTRLRLRADLQQALENDEFVLHYQPLIRLQDNDISGVEALLRWRHPTRGMIAPDEFIPLAEETGLIIPIGRWVLREGCRQAQRLRRRFPTETPPTIGINLSVKQLFSPGIIADVSDALTSADLDPSALTLEITESVMMNDTELAVERLNELRALGVRLAMDDFGTGYSSLSYLSRFPIDVLKMDRSLLAADAAPVTSGLASAVLGIGEMFNLEVVAEGIEHLEQSETLRRLGCEIGQGFYFARPMASVDLVDFMVDWTEQRDAPLAV